MTRNRRLALTLLAMLAACSLGWGYALLGSKWKTSQITMHLALGSSGGALMDGSVNWNAVATAAMGIWNQYINDTKLVAVADNANPGDGDGVNNVFFSSTLYGYSFDDAVAITTEYRSGSRRIEADVVFNSALSYNSYRGPLKSAANGDTLYDLRRVAIHELGHVLGLDHPDDHGQSVVAIMNSRVSDIDSVRSDDVAGAQALYGVGPAGSIVNDGGSSVSPPKVRVTRPTRATIRVFAAWYLVKGTSSGAIRSVFVRTDRVPVSIAAKGGHSWQAKVPIRYGRNRVRVLAVTTSGQRNLVSAFTVLRRAR